MYVPACRKRHRAATAANASNKVQYNYVPVDPANRGDRQRYVAAFQSSTAPPSVSLADVGRLQARFTALWAQFDLHATEWTAGRLEQFAEVHATLKQYEAAVALLNAELAALEQFDGLESVTRLYRLTCLTGAPGGLLRTIRRLLVFAAVVETADLDLQDVRALKRALLPGVHTESPRKKRRTG